MLRVPDVLPESAGKPAIPSGGSPRTDQDYLTWRDAVVSQHEERITSRLWHDLTAWSGLPAWRFDWLLLARLGLDDPMFPLTYHHRTRALGIALATRRRECERHAASICRESTPWL